MKKILCVCIVFLLSLLLIIAYEKRVDTSEAVSYKVVHIYDFSFPGRDRWEWCILAPDATNDIQLAQTAMLAAIRLQKEKKAAVSSILIEPSIYKIKAGECLALVDYIPDGLGYSGDMKSRVWHVETLKPPFNWENGRKLYMNREY